MSTTRVDIEATKHALTSPRHTRAWRMHMLLRCRGGLDHLPSASGSKRNSIVEDGDGEAEEEEAFDGFGAAEEADADTEFNDTVTAIASATTASKSPSAGGAASTSHFVPTSPYRPVSRMSMVDALGGGSNLSLQVLVKTSTCTLHLFFFVWFFFEQRDNCSEIRMRKACLSCNTVMCG